MDIRVIASRIRGLRLEKNLKLESVAEKAGMSATGYGNIERGNTTNLCLNRLVAIAAALGVSVFDLLPLDNEPVILKETYLSAIEQLEQKNKEIYRLQQLLDRYMAKAV